MKFKLDNFKEIPLGYMYNRTPAWRVLEDIELKLSNGDIAIIPQDFLTDFASVPRLFLAAFPPFQSDLLAFVIHDFMYDYGGYIKDGELVKVSKKFADNEMKWQQLRVKVSPFRVFPMYWAVSLLGRRRSDII